MKEAADRLAVLLQERGAGKTLCPSEVARDLAGADGDWRGCMDPVHEAVDALLAKRKDRIELEGPTLPRRQGPYRIGQLRDESRGAVLRWVLGALYLVAGYFHLAHPRPFLTITPDWVPWPDAVIFWTGIAEFAGALALLQPWSPGLRRAGAIGLAALCRVRVSRQYPSFRDGHGAAGRRLGARLSRAANVRAADR